MPRHNRRSGERDTDRSFSSDQRREDWGEQPYDVRAVTGHAAIKAYRCPGCEQEIRPAVAHVVAWPSCDASAEARRHWHRSCWQARDRRGPSSRGR